jgi:ribosomal protein L11 methyltransferase
MSWLELSVTVDQETAEPVAELLARYGYNGGVVAETPFKPGDEGPEFEYDVARPVTLRTYLPLDNQTEDVRTRIEQGLWHLGQIRPVGELKVKQLEEEDWANAWKQYYGVQRIGERTVIVPSWLEYDAVPEEIVLYLDPGMAFGTGLHPTTQLCVRLLEEYARPGQRTLDLGTGSGILAIAAAKLGAEPVLALDNDPIAVEAAAVNAVRNGVATASGGSVDVALGSLGAGGAMGHWLSGDFGEGKRQSREPRTEDRGHVVLAPTADQPAPISNQWTSGAPFDLIVGNLIAKVLVIVSSDLAAALKPGGLLITSGIIIYREDEVALALAASGLHPVARHEEGEWVALVHTKLEV